jgi:mono/diheme cytochrome c family protein
MSRVVAAAGLALAAVLIVPSVLAQSEDDPGPLVKVEDFDKGRAQFHHTCAPCHGRNMVNAGVTTYDLRKFPLEQSDRFHNSVTHGKGNMPSFKESLSPEQIDWLWAYVRSRGKSPSSASASAQ